METSEFKALKEKLFSAKKNGYDQLESAELRRWKSIAATTRPFRRGKDGAPLCRGERPLGRGPWIPPLYAGHAL